jgi:hypothetical protein
MRGSSGNRRGSIRYRYRRGGRRGSGRGYTGSRRGRRGSGRGYTGSRRGFGNNKGTGPLNRILPWRTRRLGVVTRQKILGRGG